MADIATFVMLNAAANLGAPPGPGQPRLRAWLERAQARPAVAREVAETRAFLARLFAPQPA